MEEKIELNGKIYDLNKIKKEDYLLFLDGCKVMGKRCHCCFPFYCGHITKEYEKASKFFEKKIKGEKIK